MHPRIIHEPPTRENTIPVSLFRVSSPNRFSDDDDKLVIYGGGSGFHLRINEDPAHDLRVHEDLASGPVSLYVLNTSLIIWFTNNHRGLELPYQSIILHALQTDPPSLYLQVVSNSILTNIPREPTKYTLSVELIILGPGQATDLVPQLSLQLVYEALSECASLHYDNDSDEQTPSEGPALQIPQEWLNLGDADDLDAPMDLELTDSAGLNVDVGTASLAGSVRRHEGDSAARKKSRR